MANVFISYRRPDSAPFAGRISDRLSAAFGAGHVFMDVEDIAPGDDFIEAIDGTIARCEVLVCVIGPRWLETLRAREGERDFVEHEVAAALRRGLKVIPVLVGGAVMPAEAELQPELRPLSRRQAVSIRDTNFEDDVNHLIRGVRGGVSSSTKRILWLVVAAGILIAVVGSSLLLLNSRQSVALDGAWIARMQRPGARPYTIRLQFLRDGPAVSGEVRYPTGRSPIQRGSFVDGKLAFSTTHVPQFETQPATIAFTGEVQGREIALTATMPDGGVATGTARKAD